jgi:hypothetical protein
MSTLNTIICEHCLDVFDNPYNYTQHVNKEHATVWDLLENPPEAAANTAALIEWSMNFEIRKGTPYHLFLDLIGYSEEQYGAHLFTGEYSSILGYMELDYLADALKEYALNPNAVISFIELVSAADMRDN